MNKNYKQTPLSFNRIAVRASASVTREKNTIHSLAEIDICEPRRILNNYFNKTGNKLSLTAYIVSSLTHTIKHFPEFNSFIKGRKLITMQDLTINVLTEREINGEKVPEPLAINETQKKSFLEINSEIKKTGGSDKNLGSLSGISWIRFIPGFLLKLFIRIADKNLNMAFKYGKVAVTAVGMFCKEPAWFIPHGSATVLITVGSINKKVIEINKKFESREHLCITASFDHDIIDGAPAARFMDFFIKTVKNGEVLKSINLT